MKQWKNGGILVANNDDPFAKYARPSNNGGDDPFAKYARKQPEPQQNQSLLREYGDYLQGLGVGGAESLANIGANIADAPNALIRLINPDYKFHAPRADLSAYKPKSTGGQLGAGVGEFIAPFALPVVGTEAAMAKVASPLLKYGLGAATGAGIGALQSEDRTIGGALGALPGVIGGGVHAAGKGIQKFIEPIKELAKTTKYQTALEKGLLRLQQGGRALEEKTTESMGKLFPQEHFVDTAEKLSQSVGKEKEALANYFNEGYGKYSTGSIGKRGVSDPFELNEITDKIKDISPIKKSTIKAGKSLSPEIKLSNILDESGNPINIAVPAKGASISDYVRFMRETRDAAGLAGRKASSQQITQQEKEDLLSSARKLRNLSSETTKKVESSMSKEELAEFNKINKDYETIGSKIKYNPTISKAWGYGGRQAKISDGFYKELLQPENKALREHLFAKPHFKESLLQHMTRESKHPMNPKSFEGKIDKIDALLKDKVMSGLLNPQQKKLLTDTRKQFDFRKQLAESRKQKLTEQGLKQRELLAKTNKTSALAAKLTGKVMPAYSGYAAKALIDHLLKLPS